MPGESSYRDAIARTIRRQRSDRGWSLRDLGDRSGLSTAYLSEIENGRKEPSGATLEQLGQAFDQSLAEFLTTIARSLDEQPDPRRPQPPSLAGLGSDDIAELRRFADWLRWRRSSD